MKPTELSEFVRRHIGPTEHHITQMLSSLGESSLDALTQKIVPDNILVNEALSLEAGVDEATALAEMQALANRNKVMRSLIGLGYYDCECPQVILRNVLENPAWYTAYTPYQPEIAQGRLEVLFNFQTMIAELTAMPMANASLLDEGTAASEAMAMAHRAGRGKKQTFLVADDCHPQTIDVLQTRAEPLGIVVKVTAVAELSALLSEDNNDVFAVLVQYPGTYGEVTSFESVVAAAKATKALTVWATDLLALTLLPPPGNLGADIVVGSSQRFGVPMGFGGPHAAFMACSDALKRSLPGRIIGQSITAKGESAYRLALQTREQHIRREKATSNICTAQALLAIIATLYACYHGPKGLRFIANRVRRYADVVAQLVTQHGVTVKNAQWFDTLHLQVSNADDVVAQALSAGFNIRKVNDTAITLSIDETTRENELSALCAALTGLSEQSISASLNAALESQSLRDFTNDREHNYLSQACFNHIQSETDMMRYLRKLADKDIALDRAMIPLGSCTMKLNAASEMAPVTWPSISNIHPFAPQDQTEGYRAMIDDLEKMLCACTGYDAMSLQPNAGSQGEYAGLLAIRRYHESRGDVDRTVCLIPSSAHGTNPASAQMAGMKVVLVECDAEGNVDLDNLQLKLDKHSNHVAAIMITYPSTHGVFEKQVRTVCQLVHEHGGQVYIDGANLNAMVGTAQPGQFGGDVSHLNLHKTFCIPHGGGGPGVGPIGVGAHLKDFLPGHRELNSSGAVSSAPWGSAMILPITWMYIRMMGAAGLKKATQVAMLNANYIASRLSSHYPILFSGDHGYVAHECILDTRKLKEETGISVDDIAKRLMDYGFHAPTMSFPVPGTLMVEPTESESKVELDRFCDAMLSIHAEAMQVKAAHWPLDNNPLVNAPHTAQTVCADDWPHPYKRSIAAYPAGDSSVDGKYWPPVSRVDNVYGDKNLICSCPPLSDYEQTEQAVDAQPA